MSHLKLHELDDLDKEDIVKAFNEAYRQLESVYFKVPEQSEAFRLVDRLMVKVDTLATRFEEAEYAADVYARD